MIIDFKLMSRPQYQNTNSYMPLSIICIILNVFIVLYSEDDW